MNRHIRFAVVLVSLCATFAVEQELGFGGLELVQPDNFLEQPIAEIERRAEEVTVEFSPEESKLLLDVVEEVNGLLQDESPRGFLQSDLQRRILILERDWKQREGARLVVKLLEAVRIKVENYIHNAILLERLPSGSAEAIETQERAEKFLQGIRVSNEKLEETVRSTSAMDR